jgi:hypothetical protein
MLFSCVLQKMPPLLTIEHPAIGSIPPDVDGIAAGQCEIASIVGKRNDEIFQPACL